MEEVPLLAPAEPNTSAEDTMTPVSVHGGLLVLASGPNPATWTNLSQAGKWLDLGDGVRQFVSAQEQVELPDAAAARLLAAHQAMSPAEAEAEEVTALHNSIWFNVKMGVLSRVEALLKASGDPQELVNSRDEQGHTVTHWAAKRGDLDMVIFLAEHGAPLFCKSEDDVGMTPLHWACTEGRLEVVRYFLEKGASINCVDEAGCTPLLIAAQYGMADVVAFLVKMHADTTILDKHRDSAMHWAAYKGELEIVGLLKYLSLPVDEPDAFGQTPLHLAALRGNFAVVEFLVMDCDAPLALRDNNNKTPRDLAARKGHRDVEQFLATREDLAEPLCAHGLLRAVRKVCSWQSGLRLAMGDGRTMEGVRWPLVLVLVNTALEHWVYWAKFLAGGTLSEFNALHALSAGVHAVLWVTFLAAWCKDAGGLDTRTSGGVLGRAYEDYFDELVHPTTHLTQTHRGGGAPTETRRRRLQLCHTCQIARPERAKHCRTCRKCVSHFDHHCPYVGNCVGRNNYPWFFAYALTFLVGLTLWGLTALLYLQTAGFDWTVLAVLFYFAPFWFMAVLLVSYHAQLAVANLTTNEAINFNKYAYLQQDPRGFNVYDQGLLNNAVARFLPGPTDPTVAKIAGHLPANPV